MRTLIDARLRHEAHRFALRFACEDCAYFDPTAACCLHGYPTALHRRALLDASPRSPELAFCKEFELGEETR